MHARANKKETIKSATPEAGLDDSVARIAIDEDGHIVYTSTAFCELSHLKAEDMRRCDYSAVLRFSTNAEIFGTLEDIESGLHEIHLNGHDEAFRFQFDWMTTSENKRYLIGSQAKSKKAASAANKALMSAFEDQILAPGKSHTARPERRKNGDLEAFMAMTQDCMIITDMQGTITGANPAFFNTLGYAEADLGALSLFDCFDTQDAAHLHNALRSLAMDKGNATGAQMDFEACAVTKSGERRIMHWQQSQKGGYVYCIGKDITAQKRHEAELERQKRQLSEAESIGRMGHWHWTIGQDAVEWSDEIYRIFGVDQKTFTPTLEKMNALVNRRDIGRVNQAFQRAIIEENDYDMEFRIKRPDGETRFIRCEGRCETDDEGDVTALYGIMQDMTERILYERQLKEAKEAAERAYAAKSQFLANMSHELRTPLNAIIGFSEMMQRQLLGPLGNDKYTEYIDGIHESGGHLLDLISDILDMSKIEAGKYELDFEQIDLKKTIGVALNMVSSRASEAGVTVKTDKSMRDGLSLIGDRRAILQVILNLLSNAVKFSRNGGEVRIECHEREDYLVLKIIDNGIGIPANKLQEIMHPFEQASSHYTRDHEGSGLGLAITKELTELHGGALSIESELGHGTTVSVRLPYDAYKATKATAA